MAGYTMDKRELQNRLRRIEGQVRGIQRMVEADEACVDILTQVNSATAALRSVGLGLLDDHVRNCVKESVGPGPGAGDAKVEELLAAVARFAGR
jgi:DNA-binding FrmR family transcriptional regulator